MKKKTPPNLFSYLLKSYSLERLRLLLSYGPEEIDTRITGLTEEGWKARVESEIVTRLRQGDAMAVA